MERRIAASVGSLFLIFMLSCSAPKDNFSETKLVPTELRSIAVLLEMYAQDYQRGFPAKFEYLGSGGEEEKLTTKDMRQAAKTGKPALHATWQKAGLLNDFVISGDFAGYRYIYKAGLPDRRGKIRSYQLWATPLKWGADGRRNFYTDETKIIGYTDENRLATDNDPRLPLVE